MSTLLSRRIFGTDLTVGAGLLTTLATPALMLTIAIVMAVMP